MALHLSRRRRMAIAWTRFDCQQFIGPSNSLLERGLNEVTKRRLNGIERGALVLAAVFIVVGAMNVIHPEEGFIIHPYYYSPKAGRLGPVRPEPVSKQK